MNSLSVAISSDNGLSFDLLIDGISISEILGDRNAGIPYWISERGIPTWPPYDQKDNSNTLIVTVCNCGEYGCGHSRCKVKIEEEVVTLYDFQGDVGQKGKTFIYSFPKTEYLGVMKFISENSIAKIAGSS